MHFDVFGELGDGPSSSCALIEALSEFLAPSFILDAIGETSGVVTELWGWEVVVK